jgi:TPR repeat protein
MKHDTEQNPKEAARWYRKAAEQEFLPAQRLLGKLYISGEGVPKDFIEAGKWFKLAAEQGDADAQYNLGVMHENGEGFQENFAEAAKWYQKAAEQGHGDAQYNLGLWYMNGNGVKKDVVLAYVLLNLAASNSDYESKTLANQERDSIQKLLNTSQLEEALLLSKNTQRPVIAPTEEEHCSIGIHQIPTVSNTGSVHEIKNP